MPKPSVAPLSIPLKKELLDRTQTAAKALNLSASGAVACAIESVADGLSAGWRPTNFPQSGPSFFAVRLPQETKRKIEAASSSTGIKLAEISRISVWAALYKMEGKEQVLWPFRFTKKELIEVVRLYSVNDDKD